jgi:hypothetical protein
MKKQEQQLFTQEAQIKKDPNTIDSSNLSFKD